MKEFAQFRLAAAEMQRNMDKWPRPAFSTAFAKAKHSAFHWHEVAAGATALPLAGIVRTEAEFEELRAAVRSTLEEHRDAQWCLNRLTWNGGTELDPKVTVERYVELWTTYRIGATSAVAVGRFRESRQMSRVARIRSTSALAALSLGMLSPEVSSAIASRDCADLAVSSLFIPTPG